MALRQDEPISCIRLGVSRTVSHPALVEEQNGGDVSHGGARCRMTK